MIDSRSKALHIEHRRAHRLPTHDYTPLQVKNTHGRAINKPASEFYKQVIVGVMDRSSVHACEITQRSRTRVGFRRIR